MKLTILGCGSSAGVPIIGCDCAVCTSNNPKNRRQRASALFETDEGVRILIDATPDLRNQALQAGLTTIDALVVTHPHADHCHGLDDVRSFNYHKNGAIDLYADHHTMAELIERFSYVFTQHNDAFGWYKPKFTTHYVDAGVQNVTIAGQDVIFFPQDHGRLLSLGVRVGNIAYSTDVKSFPEESFEALRGLDYWVVDCLRYSEAPTHAHLDLTLSWIERVKPKVAVLTHMAHELDYDILRKQVPPYVQVAYDGMVLHA